MGDSLSASRSGGADPPEVPFVSVIVETSTWHEGDHIDLADALEAVRQQRYPATRRETLVVVTPENRQRWAALASRFPEATALEAPPGLSLYQIKGVGLRHARGDIVTFVDADNWVGPEWLEEIVRPFARDQRIAAVLGPIRFRQTPLSRMWDAVWWMHAYDAEGPVDRIFASNSVAFRRAALTEHFVDDPRRYRGFWERTVTARLREAGYTLWLTPRAKFTHDFRPSLGYFVQRAMTRGYSLVAIRMEYPLPRYRLFARLPWITPWALYPGLLAKDVVRILTQTPRLGLSWRECWKPPAYALVWTGLSLFVLAGMVMASLRRPAVEPP